MSGHEAAGRRADGGATSTGRWIGLLIAAWAVPGLGHLLLRRRVQAAVFFAVVAAGVITGLSLHGELAVPRPGTPFSWLSTFAGLGNGIWYLVGRGLGFGGGDPTLPGFSYGNTFVVTAGLMNWLAVLDVSDRCLGRKP